MRIEEQLEHKPERALALVVPGYECYLPLAALVDLDKERARLNAELAIIDKRRERANECEALHVIGDVAGKTAVLLDDMVDTAGTLCGAAAKLMEKGASEVHACCSHAVLSGPAIERLEKSCIRSLVVTNSIPLREDAKRCAKIKVLSVSEWRSIMRPACHTHSVDGFHSTAPDT